jgi:tetratricopeptide (TPR) repeat protein
MPPSDLIEHKSTKLAKAGYEHLENGDTDAALKVAAQLEELQYTAAFEIAALAHGQLGDLDAGVAVLKRGLEIAPTVWINWQLLGNYLSDLERYDEAAAAYEQAIACPEVWESSVRLNQAVLASRRGLHDQALSYVDQVTDAELAVQSASARVTALAGAGRLDEAIRVGEAALSADDPRDSDDSRESADLADLAASVGRAREGHGAPAEEIVAFAIAALDEYERSNTRLLSLIRDADNRYSPTAKYYRMTVDAKIPFTDPLFQEAKGYVVNYDVVADSVEEALAFVERMEEPAVRGNLIVDEQEILEDRPEDPKGVYKRTARHYYQIED